jgi:hypothetical protein
MSLHHVHGNSLPTISKENIVEDHRLQKQLQQKESFPSIAAELGATSEAQRIPGTNLKQNR